MNSTALFVGLAIAVLVGVVVVGGVGSPDTAEYMEKSEEWCESRGGELYNSNSIAHGGLHCELPNGTTVHMSEVIER